VGKSLSVIVEAEKQATAVANIDKGQFQDAILVYPCIIGKTIETATHSAIRNFCILTAQNINIMVLNNQKIFSLPMKIT
jgi:hypothetical protein